MKKRILICVVCLGLVVAGPAFALTGQIPFKPGEKLVYRIRWSFITAGTAVLQVLEPEIIDGQPAQHFVLTIKTNRFVDRFYKVRSRIEGWTDMAVQHSLLYKKNQNEGRHHRNVIVTFDWDAQIVRYIDHIKNRERSAPLIPGAFDPISILYYFRTLTLEKGQEVIHPVCDGKKTVMGRGRVIKREKIKIDGTTYDTWLAVPDLKHVGGVFKKSKNAKIRLWVSADQRRVPVKVASKVIVGSFVGELIEPSNNSTTPGAGDAVLPPPAFPDP